MRIAFFADIHANLPAFECALEDARARGATHLLCLGDLVGYGPQPAETVARVRAVSNGTLLGNHDAAACGLLDPALFNPFAQETAERAALALDPEARAYLRDLPYILELPGIACAHGGFDAPERFNYLETKEDAARNLAAMPGFPLLVVGHTHVPSLFAQDAPEAPLRKLPAEDLTLKPEARYVANPGSIGFPRGERLNADYLLYDTLTRRLLFCSVPYDLTPYRLAIVRNGYNPLNYWFLSPSARARQRELAFRTPTHAATAPVGRRAPFRAKHATWTALPRTFWLSAAFLVLLTLLILLTLPRLLSPAPEPGEPLAPGLLSAEEMPNLLPPWCLWSLPPQGLVRWRLDAQRDELTLTSDAREAEAEQLLLSPLQTLPPGLERLTLTLNAQSPARKVDYAVRFLFLRSDGSQRKGRRHDYQTLGAHAYTEPIPADAVAFRLEIALRLRGSLTLSAPIVR